MDTSFKYISRDIELEYRRKVRAVGQRSYKAASPKESLILTDFLLLSLLQYGPYSNTHKSIQQSSKMENQATLQDSEKQISHICRMNTKFLSLLAKFHFKLGDKLINNHNRDEQRAVSTATQGVTAREIREDFILKWTLLIN